MQAGAAAASAGECGEVTAAAADHRRGRGVRGARHAHREQAARGREAGRRQGAGLWRQPQVQPAGHCRPYWRRGNLPHILHITTLCQTLCLAWICLPCDWLLMQSASFLAEGSVLDKDDRESHN